MRRTAQWFVAIVVLALAPPVFAQEIAIRSGEHAGFSRIVLYFDKTVAWKVGRVAGGYEFRVDDGSLTYDTSNVFEKIPRTRMTALEDRGSGRLFIASNCDCHADAFEIRGAEVVLDIKDGAAPAYARRFNQALSEIERAPSATPTGSAPEARQQAASPPPDLVGEQRHSPAKEAARETVVSSHDQAGVEPDFIRARHGLPLFLPPQPAGENSAGTSSVEDGSEAEMPGEGAQDHRSRDGSDIDDGIDDNDPATAHDASQVQQALLAQISRATAQGLLAPDLSRNEALISAATNPINSNSIHVDPPERMTEAKVPDIGTGQEPTGPEAHIRIETARDRGREGDNGRDNIADNGAACPADIWFDVGAWGQDKTPAWMNVSPQPSAHGEEQGADAAHAAGEGVEAEPVPGPGELALGPVDDLSRGADIGAFRASILGEFDRANGDAVTRLARYYIYLTFGAEAAALVHQYEDVVAHPEYLYLLAEIVDGELSDSGRLMAQFMACPGKVALWAALAQKKFSRGEEIDRAAIVSNFSELPKHLRNYLGPDLASRFLAIGDRETALELQNAIARAPGEKGAGFALLSAQLVAPDDAIRQLEELVHTQTDVSAEALLDLMALQREAGQSADPSDIALAASLAFERRGSETAIALIESEILALAGNGDFEPAFERVSYYLGRHDISKEMAATLRGTLLAKLSEGGEDAFFLRHATMANPGDYPSNKARMVAAKRLAALGFGAEAKALVHFSDSAPSPEARRLLARIALDEDRPETALGYLAGLEDETSLRLRAEALAGTGDHEVAAALYARLGQKPSQIDEAWLAGDWGQVARLDKGALGEAGAMMLKPGPAPLPEKGALEAGKQLVETSEGIREVVAKLLIQTGGS